MTNTFAPFSSSGGQVSCFFMSTVRKSHSITTTGPDPRFWTSYIGPQAHRLFIFGIQAVDETNSDIRCLTCVKESLMLFAPLQQVHDILCIMTLFVFRRWRPDSQTPLFLSDNFWRLQGFCKARQTYLSCHTGPRYANSIVSSITKPRKETRDSTRPMLQQHEVRRQAHDHIATKYSLEEQIAIGDIHCLYTTAWRPFMYRRLHIARQWMTGWHYRDIWYSGRFLYSQQESEVSSLFDVIDCSISHHLYLHIRYYRFLMN